MKYAWLEKMATDGLIRQEALDRIYERCGTVLEMDKTANMGAFNEFAAKAAKGEKLMSALPQLVSMLLVGSMIGQPIYRGIKQKIVDSRTRSMIDMNRQRITSMYSGEDKAKAEARFNQIARFAPHLAMNEEVTKELIRRKYKTEFTDNDIQNFMQMEARLAPDPMGYASLSSHQPKFASAREEVLSDLGEKTANLHLMLEYPEEFSHVPGASDLGELQKTANISGGALAGFLAAPVILGGVLTGAQYLKEKKDENKLRDDLDKSFNMMLEGPHEEMLKRDPKATREVFQTLTHFSPHVATDPLAASSFVNKILEFKKNIQATDLKDLTTIESDFARRGAGPSFAGAMTKGFEAAGMIPATMKAVGTMTGFEKYHG